MLLVLTRSRVLANVTLRALRAGIYVRVTPCPATTARPVDGWIRVDRMLIVVVLPAPWQGYLTS
jgi:hypothetical protein